MNKQEFIKLFKSNPAVNYKIAVKKHQYVDLMKTFQELNMEWQDGNLYDNNEYHRYIFVTLHRGKRLLTYDNYYGSASSTYFDSHKNKELFLDDNFVSDIFWTKNNINTVLEAINNESERNS